MKIKCASTRFARPHFRHEYFRNVFGPAFLLAVLMSIPTSCRGDLSLDQAKEKIHLQNEKLHKVVATKNTALLKDVYAEDAYFMAPGLQPVKGRDSIIALWSDGLDDVIEMRSESIEINGTPEVLYEIGIVENKIRSHNPDSVVVHKAKYTNVWKRDAAGEYRLTVDIWNRMN